MVNVSPVLRVASGCRTTGLCYGTIEAGTGANHAALEWLGARKPPYQSQQSTVTGIGHTGGRQALKAGER